MAPSHGLLWNERVKEPRGLEFLFSAAWHWPMPELLFAATPWLPWWTEASKQNKPLSPESSMTDILFQQGETGYSGSPSFTNVKPKCFTAEAAKPRLSVRLTLYASCFMTVLRSKETLGTRVPSGNRMHVYWFHTSLRSFLPWAFSGHVWVGVYTFPEILGHLGSLCRSDLTFQVYSFIKFQISKFNTWWAQGRWWLMIFLANWGERARMMNIALFLRHWFALSAISC